LCWRFFAKDITGSSIAGNDEDLQKATLRGNAAETFDWERGGGAGHRNALL